MSPLQNILWVAALFDVSAQTGQRRVFTVEECALAARMLNEAVKALEPPMSLVDFAKTGEPRPCAEVVPFTPRKRTPINTPNNPGAA